MQPRPHDSSTRLLFVLEMLAVALGQGSHREAAAAVCTELAVRLGLERASLGRMRRGSASVEAISHNSHFDDRQDLVRDLCAAMEEAADQDRTIVTPPVALGSPLVTRASERLAARHGAGFVVSVPLVRGGEVLSALVLEGRAGSRPTAELVRIVEDAAALLGPLLGLSRSASSGLLARTRAGVRDLCTRHFGADRPAMRAGAAAAVALSTLLTFTPVSHRVKADATLEGRVERAVVAGLDGFVAEANARAGDIVKAGDVLGRLDERDLLLERRKGVAGREQLLRERRQAMAEHDRTKVAIARARLAQADAQLDLIEELQSRTVLVAPFDGVVVQGDLSRSLGSPVSKGDVLFQVAPLDGYRIILQIDEREIGFVEEGSSGVLTLTSLPGERLAFAVERVTPVAISEDGHTFFRAEAQLERPSASLRPGMAGVAKLDVGRRPWVWVLTHDLVDWLRLRAWTLWG